MAKVIIVGLGSGDAEQLPLGVFRLLTSGQYPVMLRTIHHPVVSFLQEQRVNFSSYDQVYENSSGFDEVYEKIVADLIRQAGQHGTIVYGVPGHPMVAEKTVQLILEQEKQGMIEAEIIGGASFIDALMSAVRIDPIEGFVLLDGSSLTREQLNPDVHMIIAQVYDEWVASHVKLTLMELYPHDFPIRVVTAAGIKGMEKVEEIPLFELDRLKGVHQLTTVYVPPTADEPVRNRQFTRLKEVIARLRSPEGCPWDRKQTHQSLRKYLIEETYEAVDAIDRDDPDHLCEELGDVLLQIMLHSQIAEEEGFFNVYDVIAALNEKMIRRHPHVFGDKNWRDVNEVTKNWQQLKDEEKIEKGIEQTEDSILAGIPRGLPATLTALQLQKKAARVGFDWDQIEDVMAKVEEEWEELKAASSKHERESEMGDLLFAVINLARFYDVDPEASLAATNLKFKQRFTYIEQKLKEQQLDPKQVDLQEMEKIWVESKKFYP